MKVLTQKNIKITFIVVFAYKVVCVDDRFSTPIVVFRGENAVMNLLKQFLRSLKTATKLMNKHFNKNLINKSTVVGFIKNLLKMMKKKSEIIAT